MKQPTAFETFLKVILNFFIKIPNTFDKDFIKQRRHLHFIYTFLIIFAVFIFFHFFMHFKNVSILIVIIFGWFGGYMGNFIREGYREDKYGYTFDWLDIFAGTWGGITASLFYFFIF